MNDLPTVNAMPEGFRPLRLRMRPGGQAVDIQGPNIVLGRHSECDLRMPLPDVSRRHCRFVFNAGCWDIVDLGSLNGIHVNGVRVQRITLHAGDHIRLGGLEMDVEMPSAAAGPTFVMIVAMATATVLDREEYIEQVYFFRTFRERLAQNLAAQDLLEHLHEEILATTRLPLAIQFLATELKHTGVLAAGFARLSHYFTPFQAYVIGQAEKEGQRFPVATALLVLEREAQYRSGTPTPAGLFVYQFETLSRNRLGYGDGLTAMRGDSMYDADWREYLDQVRRHIGAYDFADMVYVRSELYVHEQRRTEPDYAPPVRPLFGEKEGKIARANRGRDPLFLFAALQRQLNYPEVPRPRPRDDMQARLDALLVKLREMEARLRLVEGEVRGQIDLSEFGKPELLQGPDEG